MEVELHQHLKERPATFSEAPRFKFHGVEQEVGPGVSSLYRVIRYELYEYILSIQET